MDPERQLIHGVPFEQEPSDQLLLDLNGITFLNEYQGKAHHAM
jgi:hypothetical protein